jgi:hypothetical protein
MCYEYLTPRLEGVTKGRIPSEQALDLRAAIRDASVLVTPLVRSLNFRDSLLKRRPEIPTKEDARVIAERAFKS